MGGKGVRAEREEREMERTEDRRQEGEKGERETETERPGRERQSREPALPRGSGRAAPPGQSCPVIWGPILGPHEEGMRCPVELPVGCLAEPSGWREPGLGPKSGACRASEGRGVGPMP